MESGFRIRSVREEDVGDLSRLSKLVYFINLPDDRNILEKKIRLSIDSFSGRLEDKFEGEYILVLEDLKEKKLIGSSMIIARHGSPSSPHMYFRLKEIQKYSESIHSGLIHQVLQLKFDHDGPTEIGGLVVSPEYRGHRAKLGRQLSFSRFLFIKMKRRWFKDRMLSELMPPLSENKESPLWEAVGRRFTNLSYKEADILSRKNKEFVTSLFPRGDIYTCLLPGEVRDAIGKVGKDSEPVRHMLENIGFRWRNDVDPFDGGPHYWAETDKITLIRQTERFNVNKNPLKKRGKEFGLVGYLKEGGHFCAMQSHYQTSRRSILLPKQTSDNLELEAGDPIFLMPLV